MKVGMGSLTITKHQCCNSQRWIKHDQISGIAGGQYAVVWVKQPNEKYPSKKWIVVKDWIQPIFQVLGVPGYGGRLQPQPYLNLHSNVFQQLMVSWPPAWRQLFEWGAFPNTQKATPRSWMGWLAQAINVIYIYIYDLGATWFTNINPETTVWGERRIMLEALHKCNAQVVDKWLCFNVIMQCYAW